MGVAALVGPPGFNPHHRFMTPYMRYHPDLSRQIFLTLVGFWELDVVEVPQQYYEACPPPYPPLLPQVLREPAPGQIIAEATSSNRSNFCMFRAETPLAIRHVRAGDGWKGASGSPG